MRRPNYQNYQTGQALLIIVVFFVLASLAVIGGIVGPVVRSSRNINQLVTSTRDYFVAEASTEDVLYRLRTGKTISASETLNLDGGQAVTTITDVTGGKTIETVGTKTGTTRKVEARIVAGDGVSFIYGIQTGNGGFVMSNNAQVIGNVYSNGSITGSNGAAITGSALSANSAALSADQTNNTPLPPGNDWKFADTNGTQDGAESFQVTVSAPANKVRLYLKKVSTPGNLTVRLVTDASGVPSTNTIAQATLAASLVGTSYGWIDLPFASNPTLSAGTTYWLVLDGGTSASKYYFWGANNVYLSGVGKTGTYSGSWGDPSPSNLDGYFELYLGGLTGTITDVSIGQGGIGDARAHTVTNSTIAGNLYCQTGSGNNKSCNTSQTDPVTQPFPISDTNISDWKADATAGGVNNGDYTINGSVSLGPKEITGDLIINGNLTVTGTLWIHGNVSFSNNTSMKLASSYGSNGGIVVSDGIYDISNNTTFAGSGQTGSYLLALSTDDCASSSSCDNRYAFDISNNVSGVIFNAQKGSIHFNNNAGAKEATAYKMIMDNNATITYESGLASINFVSGPSGGWNITSWKEVQ